jgi:hypothetical protein
MLDGVEAAQLSRHIEPVRRNARRAKNWSTSSWIALPGSRWSKGNPPCGGLLTRQRVARRDDQQQVVPPGAAAFEGRLIGDDLDEADIQLAIHHPVLDQLRVAHRDPWHHPRVAPLEAFDQPGQPVGPDGGAHPQLEHARQLVGELGDPHLHLVRQPEDALRVGHHQLAGGGQRHAAVAPVEQAGVELFFQLLDLEGHRGLGHEQRFRSPRKRALACNRVENLKATIGHGS